MMSNMHMFRLARERECVCAIVSVCVWVCVCLCVYVCVCVGMCLCGCVREFAIVRKSYSLVLAYNPSCTYSSKQPHVITTFWYQVPYPYSSGTIWPTWEISPGNLNLLVHRYFTCCLKISSFPVLGSTSLVLRLYFILTNLYLSLSLWGALLLPLEKKREKGE